MLVMMGKLLGPGWMKSLRGAMLESVKEDLFRFDKWNIFCNRWELFAS